MSDSQNSLEALLNRRRFLKTASLGALSLAGASLLSSGTNAAPIPGGLDAAILNFALNLEYIEAEFYALATTGAGLEAQGVPVNGSDGTPAGPVIVKPTGSTQVPFTDPNIRRYAEEIAYDEISHVRFIQKTLTALGVPYIARPKIDLYNSFLALGSLIGVANFDPFANDTNFLLAGYTFEDVGVTAYHGGAPLLSNKTVLSDAAGILAVEAYHSSLIRTKLFELGQASTTQAISNVRIQFGGQSKDSNNQLVNPDYGVDAMVKTKTATTIAPTDSNGLAFARTTQQVINIVYASASGKPGGFFPNGLNGYIK